MLIFLNWYTGRIAGLSLLHGVLFPIQFDRHVLKFILGREIGWHDMAFYDMTMYDTLRQWIANVHKRPEELQYVDQTFRVGLQYRIF